MSAEAAVQTATILSQKVGNSFSGVTNMLAPPERSGEILNAGAAALPVIVLNEVKELQQKTIESVDKVSQVLQSQLDLAEDAERRARDQAAELRKEQTGAVAGGMSLLGSGESGGMFNLSPDGIKNLLTLGLGSVFTVAALKEVFKKLGKKLLKGGAIGSMVALIADPVVDFIDNEFKLELDDDTKKDISNSLIGAGVGFALAGIPGAIIGGTLPYISRVASYISGELDAKDIKDSDFAMTALGGTAAGLFASAKVSKLLALSKYPAIKTFGLALGSVPVLIAVGAGVALGVGITFLAKKVDEYQEEILDRLGETVKELDKDLGKFAAKQEEGLFERMGINLGNLSAIGEARVATQEAVEQFGQNKEKFMADEGKQTTLKSLADTLVKYDDEALTTIMLDKTKSNRFFNTIESLKSIAAKGGFGKDSQDIFAKLAMFSDRLQNVAKKNIEQGVTGGVTQLVAENRFGVSQDQLEKVAGLEDQKFELEKLMKIKKEELRQAEIKLNEMKDAGMKGDFRPGITNEFEAQEQLVKDLINEIDGRNNVNSIADQIREIDKDLQTFVKNGGTNFLFTFEDLKKLYADDPVGLLQLIERSANQQGSNFLGVQEKASAMETRDDFKILNADNSVKTQNNNAKVENYVSKLDVNGDQYFGREGFNYGL